MNDTMQMSFGNISLPPNDEKEIKKIVAKTSTPTTIKTSDKQSTEKPKSILFKDIPTVDEIIKLINSKSYQTSAHELISDIFECGAIAISNRFDKTQAPKREEKYINIMKKYDSNMQEFIAEVFTKIYILLASQIDTQFNDYLGELYMKSETSNKNTGQFFTPYCMSKMCSEISVDENTVNKCKEENEILTLNEPACGSGGMIIAVADVLYNKYDFNIEHNLFVECSDIDSRCVYMTYLQLGLAGIPAIIYQRDTLSMQTWQRWETPAYIMQYMRFRKFDNCLYEKQMKG